MPILDKNQKTNKISIFIPSLDFGGAERVTLNLGNYFSSLGYIVEIVLFQKKGALLKDINPKIRIVDLGIKISHGWLFRLRTYISIIKYLRTNEPQFVLSCIRGSNIPLGIAWQLYHSKGGRLVFREANTFDEINQLPWLKNKIFIFLMRFAYRQADKIIANSFDTMNDLLYNKVSNSNNTKVIPNPVVPNNIDFLATESVEEPWLLDPSIKTVIGIGSLTNQKDFSFMLDSFSKIVKRRSDFRLIILGEGSLKDSLIEKIDALEVSDYVKLVGHRENVYPYLANGSVFALSSLWEGFGNVIVEALATGTPVVSTLCSGGPPMILDDGNYGVLIEKGDVEGFASALIKVATEKVFERNVLINRSKEYSVTNIAEKYLAEMTNHHSTQM